MLYSVFSANKQVFNDCGFQIGETDDFDIKSLLNLNFYIHKTNNLSRVCVCEQDCFRH